MKLTRRWRATRPRPSTASAASIPAPVVESAEIDERGRLFGQFVRNGLVGPLASAAMAALLLFLGLVLASPPPTAPTVEVLWRLLWELPTVFAGRAGELTGWVLGIAGITATMFIAAAMDRARPDGAPRSDAQTAVIGDFVIIAAFTGSILAWLAIPLLPWTVVTLPNKLVVGALAVLMGAMAALLDSPAWRNELAKRVLHKKVAKLSLEASAQGVPMPLSRGNRPSWVRALQTARDLWNWSWPVGLGATLVIAVMTTAWRPLTDAGSTIGWIAALFGGELVLAAVWVPSRVYRRTERIYATRGSRYLTSLMHLSSLWLVAISATLSTVSRSPRPEWALATSLVGWVVPAVAPLLRRHSEPYYALCRRSVAAHLRRQEHALVARDERLRRAADRVNPTAGS